MMEDYQGGLTAEAITAMNAWPFPVAASQQSLALARVRKLRDDYASQARFADVDAAAYFREFVRRLDAALSG